MHQARDTHEETGNRAPALCGLREPFENHDKGNSHEPIAD